jgi:hypothetical protein
MAAAMVAEETGETEEEAFMRLQMAREVFSPLIILLIANG